MPKYNARSRSTWGSYSKSIERSRAIAFALEGAAALVICYFMIWAWNWLAPALQSQGGKQNIATISSASVIACCAMAIVILKIYRLGPWHSQPSLYTVLELVIAAALTVVAAWSLSDGVFGPERSFLIALAISVFVALVIIRVAGKALVGLAEKYFPCRERIAVFGDGAVLGDFISSLGRQDPAFFRGFILPEEISGRRVDAKVLGTVKQLAQVINRERLDRILVPEGYPEDLVEECIRVSGRMGVTVSRPIALPANQVQVSLVQVAGFHLLDMTPIFFTKRQELIKRIFDVLVSGCCLVVLSPILVILSLLTKLTSPGPVFFISPRVGRGGRHFSFFKFRTMYVGSESRAGLAALNEKSGHLFKVRRDPRITPLGRLMRRFSLDELPQLINVLRGEMSLVGPRPLPAQDMNEDGQSSRFDTWSEQRSRVLPGITGLWQIRGRSDLSFEEMIELDVAYIRDWSLSLDWKILAITPFVVVTGQGAY